MPKVVLPDSWQKEVLPRWPSPQSQPETLACSLVEEALAWSQRRSNGLPALQPRLRRAAELLSGRRADLETAADLLELAAASQRNHWLWATLDMMVQRYGLLAALKIVRRYPNQNAVIRLRCHLTAAPAPLYQKAVAQIEREREVRARCLDYALLPTEEHWIDPDPPWGFDFWALTSVRDPLLARELLRGPKAGGLVHASRACKATLLANVGTLPSGPISDFVDTLQGLSRVGQDAFAEMLEILADSTAIACLHKHRCYRRFAYSLLRLVKRFPDRARPLLSGDGFLTRVASPPPPAQTPQSQWPAVLQQEVAEAGREAGSPLKLTLLQTAPCMVWDPLTRLRLEVERTRYARLPKTAAQDSASVLKGEDWVKADYLAWGQDEALCRKLLATWRPGPEMKPRYRSYWPQAIYRFELQLLPVLWGFLDSSLVHLVMPYRDPRMGPLVAEALVRGQPHAAKEWLGRHPRAAALGCLPGALGADPELASWCWQALDYLKSEGHQKMLIEVAGEYGGEALKRWKKLDSETRHSAQVPAFFLSESLSTPILKEGQALPPEAVARLLKLLAASGPGAPHPGLEQVKRACTPESLGAFARSLFENFQLVGGPEHGWATWALPWFGQAHLLRDAERDCPRTRALRTPPPARPAPTTRFSSSQRFFTYGRRDFELRLDLELRPSLHDSNGGYHQSLPRAGPSDDPKMVAQARGRYKEFLAQLRHRLGADPRRLESAMVEEATWTLGAFERELDDLIGFQLAQLLLWRTGSQRSAFRVAEDGTFSDLQERPVQLREPIALIHPFHLSDDERLKWERLFSDYNLLQPFPQLHRRVHHLNSDETKESHHIAELRGLVTQDVRWQGLSRLGWRRCDIQDPDISLNSQASRTLPSYVRSFSDGTLVWVRCLSRDIPQNFPGRREPSPPGLSTIELVDFRRPIGEVSPLIISEVIRDVKSAASEK